MPMPLLPGPHDQAYWKSIAVWAKHAKSDGCSGPTPIDLYVDACWEHDYHCVHHHTIGGQTLSSIDAAARFRQVIQWRSWWGRQSPMAMWRWAAVRYFGPQWKAGDRTRTDCGLNDVNCSQ